MALGAFTFILHSHIPYVLSHGRWPHGMDWLNEAVAETYIPLLNVVHRLIEEGRSPRLTFGMTPVLLEMLSHPDFNEEFLTYLENKVRSAERDIDEFKKNGEIHFQRLAQMWKVFYESIQRSFMTKYEGDLVKTFSSLQEKGYIEVITSAATHGYLPLLSEDTSIQAQIKQGIETYRHHFGKPPRGIWLPECAYRPRYRWSSPLSQEFGKEERLRKGIEEFLSENGLEYFIIDAHLLKGGKAIGIYKDRFEGLERLWAQFSEQYQPLPEDVERSPNEVYWVSSMPELQRPVAILTRDPKTSLQVWSGEWGYPGDGEYLDFHKKRFPGGLRYWRVTHPKADLAEKSEYVPENAQSRVPEHAEHFKNLVKGILKEYREKTNRYGIVTSPFDTELFGHWWFEGIEWLYWVLRKIGEDDEIDLVKAGEFLDQHPPNKVISIPEGSWGEGGYHWIWFNQDTEWTWRHLYQVEKEMKTICQEFSDIQDDQLQILLKQLTREMLLLQSSDWQFLITTFSARDYAEMRFVTHYSDFKRLADMVRRYGRGEKLTDGDWHFFEECQKRDSIFKEIDPKWFKEVEFPA